jgi:fatty-acyl-CoA synthase
MFLALQQHPRWATADFSRLRLVISGGAPCPPAIFERFWERGVPFKSGYGLTEAGPNTFWLPDQDVKRKAGSVGFPLFHVDVKIVDGQGETCPPDQVGELLIRGPHVCAGYWNRREESARMLEDGWLRTGDLARCDAEGYHTIVGRLKDVIISGGENIYPAEVEAILGLHPAVAEIALIGVPDEKWGQTPLALVVPKPGQRPTLEDLQAGCAGRLARYKLPRKMVLLDALPRTAAGKIDKEQLKKVHGAT